MGYSISAIGIYITYEETFTNPVADNKHYELNPLDSIIELIDMGAIDSDLLSKSWEEIHKTYKLSQYDAICLVVRHEYKKSLENDMNLLEIDKALEALQ